MLTARGTEGGTYADLRPVKPVGQGFPVYPGLVDDLVHVKREYDARAAHVCAVLAGWSYADPSTTAMMMVRLGLEANRCRYITLTNDTMFISSTAYLIQSACGRVALLSYRGTPPLGLIAWLADADVNPEMIPVHFGATAGPTPRSPRASRFRGANAELNDTPRIHAGFYRNQRATWFDVMKGLKLALAGRSILEGTSDGGASSSAKVAPLEALYITGHSLGAAMAAIAAFRLARENDAVYETIRTKIRGVYTFGQPMVGNPLFAEACDRYPLLAQRFFRHNFENDVVPVLPPTATGPFQHFGQEFRSARGEAGDSKDIVWKKSDQSATQLKHLVGLVTAASELGVEQLPAVKWIPGAARKLPLVKESGLAYSFYDHATTHYIHASQPAGVITEFGDL